MTTFQRQVYFADQQFPFFIDKYTIRKGEVIPPHSHDFVELVYVVDGNATHELADHTYQLSTGDVFVIEPGVSHSYSCVGTEDTTVYNVLFGLEIIKRELESLTQLPSFIDFFYLAPFLRKSVAFLPYHSLKELECLAIEQHLATLRYEYDAKHEGFELIIKTRLIEMMVLLSRFHSERRTPATDNLQDADWIAAVKNYVEQHYNQLFTLDQLARMCGMSVSSFTSKWKSATGLSPMAFKQRVQMQHACRLLDDTSRKVLDIAHEIGMNDISFFNKVFRKHTGLSPRTYRQRSRQLD
ncbi:AraC family transcriptional regulator [Paenibacillaceae bacterium]|nr:AraC family transcriptional regulator [Paenibacillaceae bacterium]